MVLKVPSVKCVSERVEQALPNSNFGIDPSNRGTVAVGQSETLYRAKEQKRDRRGHSNESPCCPRRGSGNVRASLLYSIQVDSTSELSRGSRTRPSDPVARTGVGSWIDFGMPSSACTSGSTRPMPAASISLTLSVGVVSEKCFDGQAINLSGGKSRDVVLRQH